MKLRVLWSKCPATGSKDQFVEGMSFSIVIGHCPGFSIYSSNKGFLMKVYFQFFKFSFLYLLKLFPGELFGDIFWKQNAVVKWILFLGEDIQLIAGIMLAVILNKPESSRTRSYYQYFLFLLFIFLNGNRSIFKIGLL